MNKDNLRKIGKIKTSHGLRGEVFLIVFSKDTSWLTPPLDIFISLNDTEFRSLAVTKAKPHKEGAILTLHGVSDRNAADLLSGHLVWVAAEIFSQDKENLYLVEIEGFSVFNGDQLIGTIEGFSSNGIQDLLIVGDYEIPFVKEFVQGIDYKSQTIKMQLPEGLLEINSQSDED